MVISRHWRFVRSYSFAVTAVTILWACSTGLSRAQSAVAPAPAQAAVASASCDITTTERIVAVGDVHGGYEKFVAILREAKIIDSRSRWAGGRAILVQTGDTTDRGPDSRKVLDLLRKLSDEAEKAGGRVHALLGNHEAMRLMGVYRDVGPGEFKAFRTPESEDLRTRYFDLLLDDNVKRAKAAGTEFDAAGFRKQFLEATPLGAVEMQLAFGAKGEYGRWLRERDAMVKINGIVFMHGGPSATVAPMGCSAINARVRTELATLTVADPNLDKSLIMGSDGPLWYRGLVDGTPGVGEAEVAAILKALDARALVVGHTVPDGFRIKPTFGGRVVQIDTGMLDGEFFPGGVPSALEIQGNTWTAIYEGRREPMAGPKGPASEDRWRPGL
ncbi:MAG TPA: metallophosphoesterase [Vicinamibacterales bacterium]|nr:metallophosphoesterase [Vicinamibacterales bacterium]